jgi:hypothetical protein
METVKVIELRLRNLSDLLEANPSPLQQGVLRPEAESYIVGEAKRLPGGQPIRLAVEVPSGAGKAEAESVGTAVRTHFQRAAGSETDNLRELFRNGFKALLIGLLMLSVCLFLAWYFTYQLPKRPLNRLILESFVILGWVSMWKPIEIFLYEWLPYARRRKLFRRLSDAAVTVRSTGQGPTSPASSSAT